MSASRFLPILATLSSYDRSWLVADVVAGLTLWGLVAPEAMAYAGVANLPPQAGLYTLAVSLLLYGLFGTSRQLSVGATSATAALLASSLVAVGVASDDPGVLVANATALVLIVGVIFLIAAVLRLGFITQFISEPVMAGFVMGLAVFVAVGQLYKLFGVEKPVGNTVEKLIEVIRELPTANLAATLMGSAALAMLFILPRINRRLPAGLIVLFASIAISSVLDLASRYGVEIVGQLPQGLPSLAIPGPPSVHWADLVLPAIAIFFVAYSEALGVAREFADKHRYRIDPNQELRAHAVANLASSVVGGMVASGGMSGTAVNDGAGARSSVATLVAWGAVLATVLVLTPLFTTLPEAVLAALIVHAVWHIIASRKLRPFRALSTAEWALGVVTFLGVIFIDVLAGMVIGILCALAMVAVRSSRPHLAKLGAVPGVPGAFADLARHPEATPIPGILIVALHEPMWFANAVSVEDRLDALLDAEVGTIRAIVIDAESQDAIDVTAARTLGEIFEELESQDIELFVANMHAPVRGFLHDHGFLDLPAERDFATVAAAVDAASRLLTTGDSPSQGDARTGRSG